MRGVGGWFAGEGKKKSMEKKYWFFFCRQKKSVSGMKPRHIKSVTKNSNGERVVKNS